ncbi:MAG: hypothetical protein DI563_11045 [Variovorax paradoxus]|uniref:Uncharacterized protein n=1 Tax=Variovorax paradoxus TaxID=34073 RepID=A0A2W5QCV1_VARPD|nr:MAG: hypothetical protein DI563_11045 [Variovorax paradoxus]
MPSNKSYPGLSAENYITAPAPGVITHVAIHRVTGVVTAVGIDHEPLDTNLGQRHAVAVGSVPEIGKPLAGVEIARNEVTGSPL